jgi:hypothetical protein
MDSAPRATNAFQSPSNPFITMFPTTPFYISDLSAGSTKSADAFNIVPSPKNGRHVRPGKSPSQMDNQKVPFCIDFTVQFNYNNKIFYNVLSVPEKADNSRATFIYQY